MSQKLFRQVSLDRLSSPEELDKLITVTSPKSWIALLGLIFIIGTACFWGFFGSISTKTYGEGILISSGGVYNVMHSVAGQITDIRVEPGEYVKKGDVLGRIDLYEYIEKISNLKADLEALENTGIVGDKKHDSMDSKLYDQVFGLINSINEAKAEYNVKKISYDKGYIFSELELEQAKLRLGQAKVGLERQKEIVDRYTELYKSGTISKYELEKAQDNMKLMSLEIDEANHTLAMIQSQSSFKSSEFSKEKAIKKIELEKSKETLEMLEQELADKKAILSYEMKKEIEVLQKELEKSSNIVSQFDGRVLETRIKKGDIIQPGETLFSIVREGDTVKTLEVVMYIPAEEGKKILPGMDAQISPTIVKKEEYGYMLGKVVSVSEYPSSGESMMQTLGNLELVKRLIGKSAPIEVHIDLITNENTISGYKWSTPTGPPIKVNSGTICSGSVTVGKIKPIVLVLPYVKKWLS